MNWAVPGFSGGRVLGEGATGRVVRAVRDGSGERVAIRYLAPEARERLREDGGTLTALRSPHVVRVVEYAEGEQGAAIVMELVKGVPLRRLLDESGPPPAEAALHVFRAALLGLAAAHELGIVHRDYEPGNVLVDVEGMARVTGFGIAAAASGPYTAPELRAGEPESPASDVFAAAAVLTDCLVGAPVAVRALVARGTAGNPLARPSAARFAALVDDVAGRAYGPNWERKGVADLAAVAGPDRALRRPVLLAGTVTALVLAGTGIFTVVQDGPPDRPAPQAAVEPLPGTGTSDGRMVFTVRPAAKAVGRAKAAHTSNRRTRDVRVTVSPSRVRTGNVVSVQVSDRRTDRSACRPAGRRITWSVGEAAAALWLYRSTPATANALPSGVGKRIDAAVRRAAPKKTALRGCGSVTEYASTYTFKVSASLARGTYRLSPLNPPKVTRLRAGGTGLPLELARATNRGRLPELVVQ